MGDPDCPIPAGGVRAWLFGREWVADQLELRAVWRKLWSAHRALALIRGMALSMGVDVD
jgi:hypothetical protein